MSKREFECKVDLELLYHPASLATDPPMARTHRRTTYNLRVPPCVSAK